MDFEADINIWDSETSNFDYEADDCDYESTSMLWGAYEHTTVDCGDDSDHNDDGGDQYENTKVCQHIFSDFTNLNWLQ